MLNMEKGEGRERESNNKKVINSKFYRHDQKEKRARNREKSEFFIKTSNR